ncbi:MAG: hypothetical protein PHV13_02920 [Candidatus ainarchaeum sp.]|nr:hypothetical protein [Candidatus ainarchaeum sp.]
MIEDALVQYGALGLFVAYLIYDRQVLLTKITSALDNLTASTTANTDATRSLSIHLDVLNSKQGRTRKVASTVQTGPKIGTA